MGGCSELEEGNVGAIGRGGWLEDGRMAIREGWMGYERVLNWGGEEAGA